MSPAPSSPPRTKSRWPRRLLIAGGLLVILLILAVALAPMIASRLAPGIFESSINPTIQGQVQVVAVKVGWFSPARVGPVHLTDDQQRAVGQVTVDTEISLWQALTSGMLSSTQTDLGKVTLGGFAEIVQNPDGTTNLARALAPRSQPAGSQAPAAPTSTAPRPATAPTGRSIALTLALDGIKLTQRTQAAASGPLSEPTGINDLRGDLQLAVDTRTGLAATAKGKLTGTPIGPGTTAADKVTLDVDADLAQKPTPPASSSAAPASALASFERARIDLRAAGAPVALVDALANLGGALTASAGATAAVTIQAEGTLRKLDGLLNVDAGTLKANLPIAIADGFLTRTAIEQAAPTLELQSTRGLSLLPQLRSLDQSLSRHVRVTQWPSLTVALTKLRIPSPVDDTGARRNLDQTDLRGSALELNILLSAIEGAVLVPSGEADPASTTAEPTGQWRPFATEPVRLSINVPDLAKGVEFNQSVRATIDGRPAGALTVRLSASGLLDASGHLRALAPAASDSAAKSTDALAALADRFELEIALDGVSTPLLTPIVLASGLPLDLNADVGPTLNLRTSVRSAGAAATPAAAPTNSADSGTLTAVPPVRIAFNLESNNATASAEADLVRGVLSGVGQGLRATINSAAPLARRILNTDSADPLITAGNGRVELVASRFVADLNKLMARSESAPAIPVDALSLDATLTLSDLGVQPTPDLPTNINTLQLRALLPPPSAAGATTDVTNAAAPKRGIPVIEVRSTLAHNGKPFNLEGSLDLYGLSRGSLPSGPWPDMLLGLRPVGTISLTDLPAALVTAAAGLNNTPPASESAAPGPDMARLVADLLGTGVTTSLNFSYNDAQRAEFIRAQLTTPTQSLAADAFVQIKRDRIIIPNLNARLLASADVANRALAPDPAAQGPRLEGPVGATFTLLQPIELTFTRAPAPTTKPGTGETVSIDPARLSAVLATLVVEPEPVLRTVIAAEQGSAPRTISVRLAGAQARVELPAGALAKTAGKSPAAPATVTVQARALRGDNNSPVANLNANVRHALDGTSTDVSAVIDQVVTATIDDVLALDGLLQGLAGDTAKLSLTTKLNDASNSGRITASIDAPRIRGADIALVRQADRFALASPASITLTPNVEFLNSALLKRQQSKRPAEPSRAAAPTNNPLRQIGEVIGSGGKPASASPSNTPADTVDRLQLAAIEPLTLTINRLTVAAPTSASPDDSSAATGLFKPGVFDIDAAFTSRQLAVDVTPYARDNRPAGAPVRTAFNNLRGSAKLSAQNALTIEATFDQVGTANATPSPSPSAPAAASSGASRLSATLSGFADPAGNLTTSAALIDADVNIRSFPTPVLDTLANQGGLATETLGPTVTLAGTVRQVALTGDAQGTVDLNVTSPRAKAQLKGNVRDGRLVQSGGTSVQLLEIRPQLVQQLAGSLPVVASLEKSTADEPAVLTATGLELPLDGDLAKLNGKFSIDIGIARFTTQNVFGKLLKFAGGKEQGTIGRKIEPFNVTATAGVLEYDRFSLPLGEFNLDTQGKVDLVNRQIRITTFAPFFAIAEEATGPITLGLGGKLDIINRNTQIPITTRGSLDNPSTSIDAEAFVKGLGDSLIKNPVEGIGKTIGDIFGNKKKDGEKK